MRSILLTALLLTIALPAAAQLAPWWIPEEGCTVVCDRGAFGWNYAWGEAPLRLHDTYDHMFFDERVYAHDAEGDLCKVRSISVQWSDVTNFYYDPPLKELDYPLTTGKTWVSESHRTNDGGLLPRDLILTGTVVGPLLVDTYLGPLEVIEVHHVLDVVGTSGSRLTVHYLHEQFGDVMGLISIDGCNVVSDASRGWSGIKSLYR